MDALSIAVIIGNAALVAFCLWQFHKAGKIRGR